MRWSAVHCNSTHNISVYSSCNSPHWKMGIHHDPHYYNRVTHFVWGKSILHRLLIILQQSHHLNMYEVPSAKLSSFNILYKYFNTHTFIPAHIRWEASVAPEHSPRWRSEGAQVGGSCPDTLSSWRTALCSQWSRCGWLWVPSVGGRGKDDCRGSIPLCVHTLQIMYVWHTAQVSSAVGDLSTGHSLSADKY